MEDFVRSLKLNFIKLDPFIKSAIKEDVGSGDVTTDAIIPKSSFGSAKIIAKEKGIVCGLPIVKRVYHLLDHKIKIKSLKNDGDEVLSGDNVAIVSGSLRSILIGERLALNFLQRLSGIATHTNRFVKVLSKYDAKIYDTRKTTPLWRSLEKYAVRVGGGNNHRFGLYDMFLIKDNHIDSAGGIKNAVALTKKSKHKKLKICCEARNLSEVKDAVECGVDIILLDNMKPREIKSALDIIKGRAEIEVSGGITLKTIENYAKIGVKRFSSGALTHSSKALDFSMKIS